jgi:hypothetical protein
MGDYVKTRGDGTPYNIVHVPELAIDEQDALHSLFVDDDIPQTAEEKQKVTNRRNAAYNATTLSVYLKGILRSMVHAKNYLVTEKGSAGEQIEFLTFMGLKPMEVTYVLFQMGYRNIHRRQIAEHLEKPTAKARIEKMKTEHVKQISLLRAQVFQEQAMEVLEEERKYLEVLLEKIPPVRKELYEVDPILEPARWKRLNALLDSMLEKTKSMHGIEMKREAQVKTIATIEVNRECNKGGGEEAPRLPTHRHEALEDNNIIELNQDRTVIKESIDV